MQTSGEIQLKGIDAHFASFNQKYDGIRKELDMLCGGRKTVVDQRLLQIRQYHLLDSYQRGAEAMLKLRDMFQLTGDFKDVEVLVALVCVLQNLFGYYNKQQSLRFSINQQQIYMFPSFWV